MPLLNSASKLSTSSYDIGYVAGRLFGVFVLLMLARWMIRGGMKILKTKSE
jgi:hypothetical protein